ncbi:hypothetical protein HY772_09265 [Candidatus Woesearchaeota archaeon]|nr:hypothetical protein [Candidatus Woesearchaeota archaeon]
MDTAKEKEFIRKHIEHLEDSKNLLTKNKRKPEREQLVVKAFLKIYSTIDGNIVNVLPYLSFLRKQESRPPA